MKSSSLWRTCLLSSLTLLTFSAAQADEPYLIKLDAKINSADTPIPLYLKAGTYSVRPIGKSQGGLHEAWSVWSHTNCENTQGCERTTPTRFVGMHNNYYVSSPHLSRVSVDQQPLPIVDEIPKERTESYFLQNADTRAYEVTEKKVYPDEASALAAARASVFTVDAAGRVYFALLDNSRLTDNRGGMSLEIRKITN